MNTNEKFLTTTKITFGEFIKYGLKFRSYDKFFLLLLAAIMVLIAVIVGLKFGGKWAFIVAGLYVLAFLGGIVNELKKIYKSDKTIAEERKIRFLPDKIELVCRENVSEYPYKNLTAIHETRTNFYIITSDMKGIIVIKKNCSDELIEFIRELKK